MIFYAKRDVLIMEMEKTVFYENLFVRKVTFISVNKKQSIIAFSTLLTISSSDPDRQH